MAHVFREDTGELLGYLPEPEGPLPWGITYWPFQAWVHSNGQTRSEPEIGTDGAPVTTLEIPVRNNDSSEVHLMVPADLVDFFLSHKAFRSAPSQGEADK